MADPKHLLGDRCGVVELLPVMYYELRKFPAARAAHERDGHILDATGLVREAFPRLGSDRSFANTNDSCVRPRRLCAASWSITPGRS
jgi:hypothetical protein